VIKVIVFAVIGLVIGLGGGSGVAVMRAKKALAAAHDSTAKSDSTRLGEKKGGEETKPSGDQGEERPTVAAHAPDSAIAPAPVAALPQPKHDSTAAAATPATHAPGAVPSAVPTVAVAKPPAADTARASAAPVPGRIAKIFAAMSAKDAARVLQQMDDLDVQTVLAGLNERQAAAILAGFPAERAAAISRASLRGKKGAS